MLELQYLLMDAITINNSRYVYSKVNVGAKQYSKNTKYQKSPISNIKN